MAKVTTNFWVRIAQSRNSHSAPFWGAALLLGSIQAWANRFYMGNDGVSYLDVADAYLRGDWHTALNGSWNPLYAWLISLDFRIFHPSPSWEYQTIQLLNFGVYAVMVASFEYFLRGWLAWRRGDAITVRLIAYGLFLWASLILIGVWTVNADMLVASSIYVSLGILLRALNAKNASPSQVVILGVALGIGYYSKAVMFPISLLILLMVWIVLSWRRALIATCVFGVLAMPLIIGLSKTTGHLTIGDTGRVNYAWYVDGVTSRWWQGGPARAGQPQHPPAVALDSPRVYEFGGVFPWATYPIWYDFSYWYQGVRVWIDPHGLVSVTRNNIKWMLTLLARQGGGFVLGWGICVLLYQNKARIFRDLVAMWPVWGPCAAAILLYSTVHIETRYIGAFAALLLLTAYSATHIRSMRLAVGSALAGLLWAIIFAPAPTVGARYLPWSRTPGSISWQTAKGLQKLGLHSNDKVASVCYSNRNNVLWARLARAHIVAETAWDVNFWRLSEANQRRVLAALARSGASMAVSDERPPDPVHVLGWRQVGSTNYYAYSFSQLSEPVQESTIQAKVRPAHPVSFTALAP
jgi:hypothetical protein